MKKVLRLLFGILFFIPIIVFADKSFDDGQKTANDYIYSLPEYSRYLVSTANLPFGYDASGAVSANGFSTGGFLNELEFEKSKNNSVSWLAPGIQYWLVPRGINQNIALDLMIRENVISSGVRITEYVKHGTKVTGIGTITTPWEFVDGYTVRIGTTDSAKGKILESAYEHVEVGATKTFTLNLSGNFKPIKSECENNGNGHFEMSDSGLTRTITVSKIIGDFNCNIGFSVDCNKVTFKDAPGSGGMQNKPLYYKYGSGWYSDATCKSFANTSIITLPTRVGYIFNTYKYSGKTIIDNDKKLYSNMVDSDIIDGTQAVAQWTPITYTVAYNCNGGSGSTASSIHTYDVAKNLTANGCSRTGYTFLGWNTNKNATSALYTNNKNVTNLANTQGAVVTLYAIWSANTYKFAYNYSNGQKGTYAPTSARYDIVATVSNPTRVGYLFQGWTITGHNATTAKTGASSTTVTSAVSGSTKNQYFKNLNPTNNSTVTFTAAWKPITYTVAYNCNNGTGSTASSSHTYDEAKNLTANGCSRTGYTFLGWNTNKNATTATYTNKASVKNLSSTQGATVTLYAIWSVNTYKITYNYASGTKGSSNPASAKYDTVATVSNPTRTGYIFQGWKVTGHNTSTAKTGATSGAVTSSISGATKNQYFKNLNPTNNATVTFTATWKAITYTVAYNCNGGSGSTASSSHTYDTAKALTNNGCSRTGYTFLGWNTNKNATAATYTNKASVKNLSSTQGATITLYAIWSVHTYKITYNYASGTKGSSNPASAKYDTVATISNPTRTGYAFQGWKVTGHNTSTAKTGTRSTTVTSSISGATKNQYFKNLNPTNNSTVTFTATWKANTYTVAYNCNGGSGSTASSSHTYDTAKALTNNGCSRTGYTFKGWNTNRSATTATYGNKASVKNLSSTQGATITLYAIWSVNSYKITYNYASGQKGTYAPTTGTYDSVVRVSNPTRTNYTFNGWTVSGHNTSTAKTGTSSTAVTSSISGATKNQYFKNLNPTNNATVTLTASWIPESSFSFKYSNAFTYKDGSAGWVSKNNETVTLMSTTWEVRFLESGTLTVNSISSNIDVFLVGGGGGAGGCDTTRGGGGGGGGYTTTQTNFAISPQNYSITIGGGGGCGSGGETSSAFGYSAAGGGAGAAYSNGRGGDGGSGGGGNFGGNDFPSPEGTGGSDGSNGQDGQVRTNAANGNIREYNYGGSGCQNNDGCRKNGAVCTNTRAFCESSGELFAGGGAGGDHEYCGVAGDGGGGGSGRDGWCVCGCQGSAQANKGGGGAMAGGSSGIVIIRNKR